MGCAEYHPSYLGSQPVESHCTGVPIYISELWGTAASSETEGVGWQLDFVKRAAWWGGFRVKEEVAEVWGSLVTNHKAGGRIF